MQIATFVRSAIVCLALGACAESSALAGQPFTAKDMTMLDRASEPRISPDGRFVAYNVRSTDWEQNKSFNALWILDREAKDANPRQLSSNEKTAGAARWSPDARALYFLSSRSGLSQVWRIAPDGSGAVQITSLPMDVGFFKVAPDGRSLVVTQDVYPECDTLTCSQQKVEARGSLKVSGVLYDTTLPRFWDAFDDERYLNLFSVGLAAGSPSSAIPLMKGFKIDIPEKPLGTAVAFDVTPDGKSVVFSARPSGSSQGLGTPFVLYIAPIDGSVPPRRVDPLSTMSDTSPAMSPDGKRIAWITKASPISEPSNAHLMVRSVAGGAPRQLGADFDRSIEDIAWSRDGNTIYALAQDMGQRRVFAIDASSGAVKPLTGDGHAADMDVSAKILVYTRDALDSPAQVYEIAEGQTPKQLTHVGGEQMSTIAFSPFERFAFTGWNGETVHGYVVKPYGYQAQGKYPVAYLVHGGPHSNFGNAWSYRWNSQVWAGMGYAVVMVDFHGSSSYGERFAKSILSHWGDRPLEDLQKGWSYALKMYPWLDGDRACALGGSFGGYMIAWMAGAWNGPFKCLVDHDGIFDIRSMAYSSDIPAFMVFEIQANTWDRPNAVEAFSPARLVKDWAKPMLVVHGGKDYRVPLDQGVGAYTAAQMRHIPSEFLYFPDENHWVLKPQNSVLWYSTVEKWMERWLKGDAAGAASRASAAP